MLTSCDLETFPNWVLQLGTTYVPNFFWHTLACQGRIPALELGPEHTNLCLQSLLQKKPNNKKPAKSLAALALSLLAAAAATAGSGGTGLWLRLLVVRLAGFVLARLQQRDFAGDVQHYGLPGGEVVVEERAIGISQLDAHTATDLELAALLAAVLHVLHEELQVGHGQHVADLYVGGVVHAVLLGQPAALLASPFAVDVGGINADPPVTTIIIGKCEGGLCFVRFCLVSTAPSRCALCSGSSFVSWVLPLPF